MCTLCCTMSYLLVQAQLTIRGERKYVVLVAEQASVAFMFLHLVFHFYIVKYIHTSNFINTCSPMDPAKVIAECIYSFQHTKNKISEQTKSLLAKRQQTCARHLSIKLQELQLGPNTEECLQGMREKVYRVSRDERAEEENRPAWYMAWS